MPTGPRPSPPDDTCRVALTGTFGSTHWANIFWLRLTSAGSPNGTDLASVLGTLVASYATRFDPHLPGDIAFGTATGVWLPGGGTEIVATSTSSHTGGGSGEIAFAGAAVVLSWHDGLFYRGGHPRTYLPGVCSGDTEFLKQLTAAAQSAITTAAGGFMADVNAAAAGDITAVELGTVHFQIAGAWRTPPTFRPYQSVSTRRLLGAIDNRRK